MVFQEETAPAPDWIPTNSGGAAPWYESLAISHSTDGLAFDPGMLFLPHAGVAHLTLTQDDLLVATFQYFSYTHQDLFDRICFTTSEDFGQTWSAVQSLQIDMPGPGSNPADPTLLQLDDGSFRIYFTYHQHGDEYPQLYSAHSESLDGIFQWEGKALETDQLILDPAVAFFAGNWHHYTTNHQTGGGELIANVHSTSPDGTKFVREEDIPLAMDFLGDVIAVDGKLRFYNGPGSAVSEDGFTWEIEPGARGLGPDPGVVQLPDGSFLAVYTDMKPE
jgi:hypothetical protein